MCRTQNPVTVSIHACIKSNMYMYPVNLQLTTGSMSSNLFPLTCQPLLSLFRYFFSSGSCLTFSVLLPSPRKPLLPLLGCFFSSGYSSPSQPLLPLISSSCPFPFQPLLPLLGRFLSSMFSLLFGSLRRASYASAIFAQTRETMVPYCARATRMVVTLKSSKL